MDVRKRSLAFQRAELELKWGCKLGAVAIASNYNFVDLHWVFLHVLYILVGEGVGPCTAFPVHKSPDLCMHFVPLVFILVFFPFFFMNNFCWSSLSHPFPPNSLPFNPSLHFWMAGLWFSIHSLSPTPF